VTIDLLRYERRGWVTFSHDTNIKDVCGRIGSQKVNINDIIDRDCHLDKELSAELSD
jgi:hypothetical protein